MACLLALTPAWLRLAVVMFCIDLYRGFITKREIPGTIIYFYTPTAVVRVVASFAYYILVRGPHS